MEPASPRRAQPVLEGATAVGGESLWVATPGWEEAAAWSASGAAGSPHVEGQSLVWQFARDGAERTYLSRPLDLQGHGPIALLLDLRSAGWQSCALTVGWQDEDGHFWRLRLRHVRDGEWQRMRLREGSLEFAIHNGWKRPHGSRIRGIRIVAVGAPGPSARLELGKAELRSIDAAEAAPHIEVGPRRLPLSPPSEWRKALAPRPRDPVLHRYLRSQDLVEDTADPLARARDLRERGIYRLESARPVAATARWRGRAAASEENAWRFRWHALESCRFLLSAFRASDDDEYLYMAREHATHWLEQNFHRQTDDQRYAWYDHATALRAMSLLAIWDLGQERDFDVMTLTNLLEALHAHGELLASETFLARNQPYREHNHALFQAIALLFIGQVTPFPESRAWSAIGAERCRRLLSALVSSEGVCIENSIAYHTGLARLADELYEVFEGYGLDEAERFRRLHSSLREFEAVFRYPDGTAPAVGDSWHFDEDAAASRRGRARQPSPDGDRDEDDRFYPASGYAVLRKRDSTGLTTRQLNLTCSAINVTHKHADQLSLTFWADGVEWLADPGLYKYGADDAHAAYFRHARAHNALILGDMTYPPRAGNATLVEASSSNGVASLVAEHGGYDDVVVRRSIEYDKGADRVAIVDDVQGAAAKRCELWFHAGLGVRVSVGADGDALLSHPHSDIALLVVPGGGPHDVAVFRGQEEPFAAGWIYTRPGRPVRSESWRYACDTEALPLTTALVPGKRERLLEDREAILRDLRVASPSARG